VLNTTFGGTILFNPVNTFMYCILGSKIDTLQQGLTWMSEHAQVALPRLPPDVLLLSDASMSEIAQPISAAAVGSSSGDDDDEGVVGTLITHFQKALEVERTFYAILLGVWLAFALIGLLVVVWNSGVSDRYDTWRDSRRTDGEKGGRSGPVAWPWKKEHPIYAQHTEDERRFRGTSPSPALPHIAEPTSSEKGPGPNADSFFNYSTSPPRPFVPRTGTFGSTISSLAAPGQAFLKLSGRGRSDDNARLTDGNTSEKYNSFVEPRTPRDEFEILETPPPFWVNKFYRAVDSARSVFPTRGQKHGAALGRSASDETAQPTSASQASPSAIPPPVLSGESQWSLVDPAAIGRALDSPSEFSRYPVHPVHPTSSYPRRLSRAPTLTHGAVVSRDARNIFDDPPTLPSKSEAIDYLTAEPRDFGDYEYEHTRARDADMGVLSPASSTASYIHGEAHVESANRVQTGTAALAAILANMDNKRTGKERIDPFANSRDVGRENRI